MRVFGDSFGVCLLIYEGLTAYSGLLTANSDMTEQKYGPKSAKISFFDLEDAVVGR